MTDRFIGRDGKEYTYANVLGQVMLCEVVKPKKPRPSKAKQK